MQLSNPHASNMQREKEREKKTYRSVALASGGSGWRRRGVRHAQTDNMVVTMMMMRRRKMIHGGSAAIGRGKRERDKISERLIGRAARCRPVWCACLGNQATTTDIVWHQGDPGLGDGMTWIRSVRSLHSWPRISHIPEI